MIHPTRIIRRFSMNISEKEFLDEMIRKEFDYILFPDGKVYMKRNITISCKPHDKAIMARKKTVECLFYPDKTLDIKAPYEGVTSNIVSVSGKFSLFMNIDTSFLHVIKEEYGAIVQTCRIKDSALSIVVSGHKKIEIELRAFSVIVHLSGFTLETFYEWSQRLHDDLSDAPCNPITQLQIDSAPNMFDVARAFAPELFRFNYTKYVRNDRVPIPCIEQVEHCDEYAGKFYKARNNGYIGYIPNELFDDPAYPYLLTSYEKPKPEPKETYTTLAEICESFTTIRQYAHPDVSLQERPTEHFDVLSGWKVFRFYEEKYNVNIVFSNITFPQPHFHFLAKDRSTLVIFKRTASKYKLESVFECGKYKGVYGTDPVAERQVVDMEGKRRYIFVDGAWVKSEGRPLNMPETDMDALEIQFEHTPLQNTRYYKFVF